jgi:hypothetical protein
LTKVRNILASVLIATGLLLPLSVHAQSAPYVTDNDIEVAVRTFSFVYGMPKGDVTIEIVYDPNNAASAAEASQLKEIIGKRAFANRQVRAKMVPLSQMGSTKSRIAYVTHGLEPQYDLLLEKAKANKMLTFSTDFQCVSSQKCVMGVEASPGIRIEISRAATAASDLEFSQALKLMIREVE